MGNIEDIRERERETDKQTDRQTLTSWILREGLPHICGEFGGQR